MPSATIIEREHFRGDILQRIRSASGRVARRAEHVAINPDAIDAFAARIPTEGLACLQRDPRFHFQSAARPEDEVAYILILDAINYGSGYFRSIRGKKEGSGYYTVAAGLRRRFVEQGPLRCHELARISADDLFALVPVERDETSLELMHSYALSLRQLGTFLLERFDGRYGDLVAAAGRSAQALVHELCRIDHFRDGCYYDGIFVPFLKRAQMTVADLFISFHGEGFGRFEDLDRLTVCADNLLPHVLRIEGVLTYSDPLSALIEKGACLDSGDPMEVEIRACTVQACERLNEALLHQGKRSRPVRLDNYLWHLGQDRKYRSAARHVTKTVFY